MRQRSVGQVRRATLAALVLTSLSATTIAVAVGDAPGSPVETVGRPLAWSGPGFVLIAVLVVSGWLLVGDHRGSAVGLWVIAAAWMLPALAAWPLLPAHSRSWLLAAAPLSVAGIASVTAGWRSSLHREASVWLAIGLASVAAAVYLAGYDPFFDPACALTCDASPAAISHLLSPRSAVGVSAALTAAATVAAVLSNVRSPVASTALRVAASLSALAIALAAVLRWWRWGSASGQVTADLSQSLGTALMAVAVLVALLHGRNVRRNVRGVLEQLAGRGTADAARSAISAVRFTVPDDGRWIDATGHPVGDEEPQRCAVLSDRHGPTVLLVLRRWADPHQVLSSVSPAGRLAFENARLQAAIAFRIAEVQASQRRIVESTDRERRRIERDLHDGAQQRLVAVAMHLGSPAKGSRSPVSETLARSQSHVRDALAALRELSHNSLAAVLGAEGLQAALEELVAMTPLQVHLQVALPEQKLSRLVQTTAYLTVRAGLDNVMARSDAESAWVALVGDADGLAVTVVDRGVGGAVIGPTLRDVADRVGALGGSLDLSSSGGQGTTLRVWLPCAS